MCEIIALNGTACIDRNKGPPAHFNCLEIGPPRKATIF
jgi:hypothetical protein